MTSSSFINEDICTLEVDYFLKKSLGKNREIPSGSILQIQQISNLSVPKQDGQQNYEAERHVLKITLTDGDITAFALVIEPLQRINMNTPPGAKIKLIQAVSVNGQIFLLTKNNHLFLGGDVPKLIEKWNFQRKMDIKQEWGATGTTSGSEGPPIWRPFGQKSTSLDIAALRKTKAMDIVNENKESAAKEGDGSQTQFDLQRNEAISELMEKNVKQKFQKPNKHLLDKDIVVIMEEGFSIEEATEALKRFKIPQRALKFLKARNGEFPTEEKSSGIEDRKERKKRNPKDPDEEEDNVPIPKEYQRPTRNISLFGFIAEHIKSDDNATDDDKKMTELSDSFENMDYPDRDSRGRGGRGYRGRGANQRFRGSDGNGIRRGGYTRADSENNPRIESKPSYYTADRSTANRGRGSIDSRIDGGRQDYSRGRGRQDSERDHSRQDYNRGRGRQDSVLDRGRGRDQDYTDNKYELGTQAYNRSQGRQEYNRGQGQHDYDDRDKGRQEYKRDQGGQDFNSGQARTEYNRGSRPADYSRDQNQQEYKPDQRRQEYNRDQVGQDYNRGGGQQDYNRDQGQQDYNRDQGRQDYNSRGSGRQGYTPRPGQQDCHWDQDRQDYNRDHGGVYYQPVRGQIPSTHQNEQTDYPSLSQTTDSHQGYSQAPRFQKQNYPSSGEPSSVPFNQSGSRGLPSSQSFPQPEKNQNPYTDHLGRPYARDLDNSNREYNSRPRLQSQANGFRMAPPEHEQNQYGNSDGWSPNQSMVFTRSRPGGGGGSTDRGRGGGGSSARY